jgi:transposase
MVVAMPYVQTMDRNQMMMCSMDAFVGADSVARVVDAFAEGLDLEALGFRKAGPAAEGRPAYDPKSLVKLYLYGSRKGIRSSRRLEEACGVNVEVMWLMGGTEPDFRTISDFRKDNVSCMRKVFHEFNDRVSRALPKGFKSVDGSKFHASNSKDNNFTANKLDDRIQWLNNRSDEYLRQLAEMDDADDGDMADGRFTKAELDAKLQEAAERLERYEAYRRYMEENGLSQLSLTDADAKLMKGRNGFVVAYNVQTATDSETHLIDDYRVTNQPTDHGLIGAAVSGRKGVGEIVEVVADKGYNDCDDMAACLENGIVPHVALPDGKDGYELEFPYEACAVDGETLQSRSAEDIRKCLRSGNVPDAYRDVIESIEVTEKRVCVGDAAGGERRSPYGSEEEMRGRAAEGYFVRDPERNIVYCPVGETLRQKCVKKSGDVRYANKPACRRCKHRGKCCKGGNEWREVDFGKDALEKPNRNWLAAEGRPEKRANARKRYEMKTVVKAILRPDRRKTDQRKCLSEHPFGTIKRALGADHYLLRGMRKVDGETALMCLGYNLGRAMSLLGFQKLMEVVA